MDYMMLEPCTNECMGFTTDTDVMRELGLTFCQFKKLHSQNVRRSKHQFVRC